MKIVDVRARVLSTAGLRGISRYEDTAGLGYPEAVVEEKEGFPGRVDRRHICVYPADSSTVLVQVEAENGLVGCGESHAPAAPRVVRTLIEDLLAPVLIGQDARQIDVLWERMFSTMRLRSHTEGFTLEGIAGVDIALWDLLGKLRGEPIWLMLGGAHRKRLPVYSSGIPGNSLEERVAMIDRLLEAGFAVLKASCGRGTVEEQMGMIEALSRALGERGQLLVDAHGGFDLPDALRFCRFLEGLGNIAWFEDPLVPEDHRGYAELRRTAGLRIAMGETECNRYGVRDRLLNRECDLLLPDVCRAGGISETLRIARLADLFGLSWASHVSISTPIHLVAGLHAGAATPNFFISEFPTGFADKPFGDRLLKETFRQDGGYVELGDAPGLGIELDEEAIGELTIE